MSFSYPIKQKKDGQIQESSITLCGQDLAEKSFKLTYKSQELTKEFINFHQVVWCIKT